MALAWEASCGSAAIAARTTRWVGWPSDPGSQRSFHWSRSTPYVAVTSRPY